jgi:hypothetical protein
MREGALQKKQLHGVVSSQAPLLDFSSQVTIGGQRSGFWSWPKMVLRGRIELPTSSLPMMCSTTELPQHPVQCGGLCHKRFKCASAVDPHFSNCHFLKSAPIRCELRANRVGKACEVRTGGSFMKKTDIKGATGEDRRKARLAEALRNNLALRKARSRSAGAAGAASADETEMPVRQVKSGAPASGGDHE